MPSRCLVAEDFAPFNIDVTTFDSVQARLDYNNVSGMSERIGHVVMTLQTTRDNSQIHKTPCSCGGIAYLGVYGAYSFVSGGSRKTYNPAFVYNGGASSASEAIR